MLTGKEDLLQALVEAYIMEKGTKVFYAQAASNRALQRQRRASRTWPHGRQALTYIQSLYQALLDDRELEEFNAFSTKARHRSPRGDAGEGPRKRMEKYAVQSERTPSPSP